MLFSTKLETEDNIDIYLDEIEIKTGDNVLKLYIEKNTNIEIKERFIEEEWFKYVKAPNIEQEWSI